MSINPPSDGTEHSMASLHFVSKTLEILMKFLSLAMIIQTEECSWGQTHPTQNSTVLSQMKGLL